MLNGGEKLEVFPVKTGAHQGSQLMLPLFGIFLDNTVRQENTMKCNC